MGARRPRSAVRVHGDDEYVRCRTPSRNRVSGRPSDPNSTRFRVYTEDVSRGGCGARDGSGVV